MKKIVSIALFAIMILNLCFATAVFADDNDSVLIYSTQCNDKSDIVSFSTPTVKAVNDDVAKKLGENNFAFCLEPLTGETTVDSNYMRINLTDDNTKTYTVYNPSVTNDKKIVYKTKFYFTTEQVTEFMRHFTDSAASAANNYPHISFVPKVAKDAPHTKKSFNSNFRFFKKDGKFVYGNLYGTDQLEIFADIWHEYTAILDFASHTADIYIDETQIVSAAGFENKTITVSEALMCGIEFFDGTNSKSATNAIKVKENGIYFDDIKIYQGIGNLAADASVASKGDGTYDINVNFSTEIDSKNAALVTITDEYGISIGGTKTLSSDGKKIILNVSELTYNSLEQINVTIPQKFRDVNYQSFAEEKLITVTIPTNKENIITDSAQVGSLDTSFSKGTNAFRTSNATVKYVNDTVSQKLGSENNALKITFAASPTSNKIVRKTIPKAEFAETTYRDINQSKPIYTKAKIYIPSETVEKLGDGYLQFGVGSKDNETVAVPGGRIYKDSSSKTGIIMQIGKGRTDGSGVKDYVTYEVPVDEWFEYATELSFVSSTSGETTTWDYQKARIYLNGQALAYKNVYDMTPASWYDSGFNGYMIIASKDVGENAEVYFDNIDVYQTKTAISCEYDVLYNEDNKLTATVNFGTRIDTNNMNLISLAFANGEDATDYIVSKTLIDGKSVQFVLNDENLNGNGDFKIVIPASFHDVDYQKLSETDTEYTFSVPNYREVYVKSKTGATINDAFSNVSGSIVLSNRSMVKKDAWIAFAVYADNNELIGVDTAEEKEILSGDERTVNFTAVGEENTFKNIKEIKVLIWDSLNSMCPYQNAELITILQSE